VIDKPAGCALQAELGSEAYIKWKLIMDCKEKKKNHIIDEKKNTKPRKSYVMV
jgi:hypothetical protein